MFCSDRRACPQTGGQLQLTATTTVVVLDGEVGFSDKENKKTVIVKKNQKSTVKPGDSPTDPEKFDPEKILKWWE